MKCGARVALGVAGGYLLGRTKKMKLALMVGGLAAGRKAGGPGQLLAQGTKLLGQSADLTRLSEEIRGRLLDAGKAAALAVATRQVEALTERVVNRVGSLTDTGSRTVSDVGETAGDVGRTAGDVGRAVRGRQRADEVEDEVETSDEYDDEYDDRDNDEVGDENPDLAADDADDDVDDGVEEVEEDEVAEDDAAAAEEEEGDEEDEEAPPPPPRRKPRTTAGGRRAARTGLTPAAGDAVPATRRATGRRSGRSARGRQESSDG